MAAPSHPLRLYAHRGASARLPENTLAAFHQGLEDGATALELDLHRTADGVLVVHHDADGRRTAGETGRIAELTLAEVRRWDLGAGFRSTGGGWPDAGRGHQVPTLAEVLEAFPETPLVVDLKPADPAAAESLLEVLASHDADARVTVGSFHGSQVRRLRRSGRAGPSALTRGEVAALSVLPTGLARRVIGGEVAAIPRRAAGIRLDRPSLLGRARRLGLRVDYWVVNDPATAGVLLERGATGIMSDDPRRVLGVFEALPTRDGRDRSG